MGAFLDQIVALGARQFYDGSNTNYSSEAGYSFTTQTFGPAVTPVQVTGNEIQTSLVKTETNSHLTGGFFLSDLRDHLNLAAGGGEPAGVDEGTITLTGRFERDGGRFGPPAIDPDVTTDVGTAFEANTGDLANSNGFLVVQFRVQAQLVGFWDLHITANDTIGIATYSDKGWGDLRVDYPQVNTQDRWGRRKCYTHDTGYPAALLFDGRPHLLTVRFRAHNQSNPSASPPLAQDNWVKVSIDGTNLAASSRGPALTGHDGGIPNITMSTHAWDELVFWDRALSDAEVDSMWGPTVWGDDWPHPGSGLSSASAGHAEMVEALTRVVDWPYNWSNPSAPRPPQVVDFEIATTDVDPAWVQGYADEVATVISYDGTRRAGMGEGTWESTDPWSSARDRGLAVKWLDNEEDVALLATPIRSFATVYASLDALEDQAAGTSSGRSSVSGDLTVAIILEASGEIHGSSTVYAITIGDLVTLAAGSAGSASASGDLSHGQTEPLSGLSAGGSSASGDLLVTRYTLIGGEEVDGNGMPMDGSGRRRSRFTPLSVGYASERAQGISVGAGVGIDGIGLGS